MRRPAFIPKPRPVRQPTIVDWVFIGLCVVVWGAVVVELLERCGSS